MLKLIYQNLQNRIAGDNGKANAQLGLVHPPAGDGKIIWLVAGQSRQSVLLACGLLAAIRDRRKDVRLVLTYQAEYKDIIIQHLSQLEKIGFGYGCADTVLTATRMIKNLAAHAVIFVGESPSEAMLKAIDKTKNEVDIKHKLLFQTFSDKPGEFEASYPDFNSSNQGLSENSEFISAGFEAITRLVQSQVEQQLGVMLCGNLYQSLFLVNQPTIQNLEALIAQWKISELLTTGLLVINSSQDKTDIQSYGSIVCLAGFNVCLLSEWNKQSLKSGTIVIADDYRWYPALAASSNAIHIYRYEVVSFWQSLASGSNVTINCEIVKTLKQSISETLGHNNTAAEIINHWQFCLSETLQSRKQTDKIRTLFWTTRRQAENELENLLARIYRW